eukprot:318058_1
MSDDETFENVDSGSSLTYPMSAGNLKKGDHVCIKNHPCKIIELTTSKTGKHGHAKANITAVDIFTGRKYEEVSPSSHALPAPFVKSQNYQLLDIAPDGHVSLMDDEAETRDDIKLPENEELAGQIKEAYDAGKSLMVTVVGAMGVEQILSWKVEAGTA